MQRVILSSSEVLVALRRIPLIVAAFLAVSSTLVLGQTSRPPNPSESVSADKGSPYGDDGRSAGSVEEEMRAKRAIKYAEKEYREHVDRAREISALGVQLRDGFKSKKTIDREGIKALERLEKLTKKLRSEAGGSEEDVDMQKPPPDLATAITRLAEVADSLADKVEKTPRQVISATVIDEANVLLELIRATRTLTRTAD